ncbi:MAG: Protein-L-isoaspartate(D-aspartate) O-methyltransferase [Candidatus Curtissbacteria bacterium GW2011_GWC2_38_9]|uniref:Protein-L-isoaspartate O-methyltransferase n=1 Tax=Candidatus Curtissbacteria bacterium GW2011_GWC2_38_9 TaxID=1618414 RepID=A0A0G0LJM2_9BACT|nr:MAG: Protein-L-isoaspartate(D-aspartate) O-methyltransferase [Candidatus Curtissbacteria bacterium GW2011_GWC2_38_9]
MDELIRKLKEREILRSKNIEKALRAVPRELFVPESLRKLAYDDEALPIGYGQTISQPYTVVFMLELLEIGLGQTILEAGFGSGWQSALLAHLVGEKGHVYAFEIVPELCSFGGNNLARFPALDSRVTKFCRSATSGLAEYSGKIDRIIAAAEVDQVPTAWREQLKIGGILVYPSKQALWREKKIFSSQFEKEEFYGFVFVPYV